MGRMLHRMDQMERRRPDGAPVDVKALEVQFGKQLASWFRERVLDHYLVDELVQDVLLSAWTSMPAGLVPAQRAAWIWTAARFTLSRSWRQAKRSLESPVGVGIELDTLRGVVMPDIAPDVVGSVALNTALAEFPDMVRKALDLHIQQGYTIDEVAAMLDMGPQQLQKLVRAASRRLMWLYPDSKIRLARVPWEESDSARPTDRYEEAIAALSIRKREVVVRHVYRRMAPVDIAVELGIKPGCARVHLCQALSQLAELLHIDRHVVVDELRHRAARPRAA